jgi:branched-chain amino acid transport system substrate-binding protein
MKKLTCVLAMLCLVGGLAFAEEQVGNAGKPIKIGFSMPLTGGLSSNGKSALLAFKICAEEWNARGGVLGRQVELVYYDDHSNASEIPGIYTKLITVDKVDFVISSYGTPNITAAMPVVMENKMIFPAIFAMEGNQGFNYPYYFSFFPLGPNGLRTLADLYFAAAVKQNPACKTAVIVGVDNEYGGRVIQGAMLAAKDAGLTILNTIRYAPPPTTIDFTPILRSAKATNADCLFFASYPVDSMGLIRAAKEINYTPKMFGGAMVGLQNASVFTELGTLLNGVIAYGYYAPEDTVNFGTIREFLKKYQVLATKERVDELGYYLPPYAYAAVDMILKAVKATKSLEQKVIGDYLLANGYDSIIGKGKWHKSGEFATSAALIIQFQNIKSNKLEEFKETGKLVIVSDNYKSGNMIYPFPGWK